jgi:hypothetical protein
VAEEKHPEITGPFMEIDFAGGGGNGEVGGGIANFQTHDQLLFRYCE